MCGFFTSSSMSAYGDEMLRMRTTRRLLCDVHGVSCVALRDGNAAATLTLMRTMMRSLKTLLGTAGGAIRGANSMRRGGPTLALLRGAAEIWTVAMGESVAAARRTSGKASRARAARMVQRWQMERCSL